MRKIDIVKDKKDHILVISGASGVGKTTTCAMLGNLYPDKYVHIPFDRSRASRPGEFGSRQVDIDTMFQKYKSGEYFNIAQVTHGGYAAIRTADILQSFKNGKIAVLEYPLEQVDVLEKIFPTAYTTVVELVAPSEKERFERLKKDHKYTEHRIESDKFGSGRIERYKTDNLLTPYDHNLVLITETGKLRDTVEEIHKYMLVQTLSPEQLAYIEKRLGVQGVQNVLKAVATRTQDHTKSENYEFLENKLSKSSDYER